MKTTMVIPSYWGRKKNEGWKSTDSVYDHPTPLDGEGTLRRALESLSILENQNFDLVILGIATAEDIQEEVEERLEVIIKENKSRCSHAPLLLYSLKAHPYTSGTERP